MWCILGEKRKEGWEGKERGERKERMEGTNEGKKEERKKKRRKKMSYVKGHRSKQCPKAKAGII
jgi:hypothetical protein